LATGGINRHKGALLKYLLLFLVMSASIASGIMLSLFAAPNVAKLDEFLFRYFQPNINTGVTGLSDQTTLQSVSALHKRNNDKVAIRVFSDSSPEYLRAHVRDSLKGRVWESTSPLKPLRPTSPPTLLKHFVGDNQFFQVRPADGNLGQQFQVWSADYQRDLLFTTLSTACVAASPTLMKTDAHLHCAVEGLPRSRPYLLVDGAVTANDILDDATRQQCLQVPESLTETATQACMTVTKEQQTVAEKIRTVAHYFRSNYTYQYGIQIPPRQDPLSYFLTERPPAHCEYFASGAVIMLRLAGVPARYVTGFVVTEKNTSGGYWIARNRDAHAWAEAWDDQRGWVTVEATPPDGLPHSKPTGAFAAFRDRLKFKLAQVLALIRENGIHTIGELLRQLIIALSMTLPGRVLLVILLLGTAAYGLRNYRPHWRKQRHAPEEETFLRFLARADREAAQRGFVRKQNETLHHFGNRLLAANQEQTDHKALGNWYITCAALRCDGTPAENANAVLQEQLKQILNTST
jgi:protein-glutamine gamma-glutamyltransferase